MKLFPTRQSISGFTLTEVILYISLAAFTLLATSTLFFYVIQAKIKQQAISEVEEQGNTLLRVITQTIRNAQNFDNLSPGTTSATQLSVTSPSGTSTVFTLVNGTLNSRENGGSDVALTSPRVIMTNLLFENLGQPTTIGAIRIRFTLSTVNQSAIQEFSYQQTFYGSATTR